MSAKINYGITPDVMNASKNKTYPAYVTDILSACNDDALNAANDFIKNKHLEDVNFEIDWDDIQRNMVERFRNNEVDRATIALMIDLIDQGQQIISKWGEGHSDYIYTIIALSKFDNERFANDANYRNFTISANIKSYMTSYNDTQLNKVLVLLLWALSLTK